MPTVEEFRFLFFFFFAVLSRRNGFFYHPGPLHTLPQGSHHYSSAPTSLFLSPRASLQGPLHHFLHAAPARSSNLQLPPLALLALPRRASPQAPDADRCPARPANTPTQLPQHSGAQITVSSHTHTGTPTSTYDISPLNSSASDSHAVLQKMCVCVCCVCVLCVCVCCVCVSVSVCSCV